MAIRVFGRGVGSGLSVGNFWQGALIGGMVAGLNHSAHCKLPLQQDPYSKTTTTELTQKEFVEYIKRRQKSMVSK